jgi:quinol-cytochrome oxidoreductase complex cytochrome b subunit
VNLDWPFLWAFLALTGLVLAPIRYVTIQVAPAPVVWVGSSLVFVICFVVADWLDRSGFRRLGADPRGAGAFVVLQFLVAPSIALAAVPAPATSPWLAVLPTWDPAATRPAWFLAFLAAIPVAGWLSLYGGFDRLGADVAATTTFVLAWGSLALLAIFVLAVIGDVPRATLARTLVGLEAVAAIVAYGPTRRSFIPNA